MYRVFYLVSREFYFSICDQDISHSVYLTDDFLTVQYYNIFLPYYINNNFSLIVFSTVSCLSNAVDRRSSSIQDINMLADSHIF